jgi:dienelactone hydrolase
MSIHGRFATAVLCAAIAGGFLAAQDPTPTPKPKPADTPHKGDKPADKQDQPAFVVVQVDDAFQVVARSEVDALRKKLADQFHKAKEQYDKDKAAAEAAHAKFDRPMPKMAHVSVKGSEHATKAAAEAAMQKLIEAQKKDAEKPKDKPKDEPKPDKPKGGGNTPDKPKGGGR